MNNSNKTTIIISATVVATLIVSSAVIQKIDFQKLGDYAKNFGTVIQKIDFQKLGDYTKNFGTPLGAVIAVCTYKSNEKSKRLQYVEGKIKGFENDLETINVRKMLNTELQCVELFPFVEESTHRYVFVQDFLWAEALLECKCNKHLQKQHDSINKKRPLDEQGPAIKAVIRDNFNRFLNHLQQFEKMIKSEVVSKEMLSDYLEPWFDLIKNANDEDCVECPISKKKYTPKEALLEYMGILDDQIPPEKLSVIQTNVRNLIKLYPEKFDEIVKTNDTKSECKLTSYKSTYMPSLLIKV